MHRIGFTSCAHGMFLPTGSTPALPRDESKLHTTHTAAAACGLWSPPTTCWHRRNSVPPLGTRAWPERHSLRMRLACSRRRRRTDGVDHVRMPLDSRSAPWHTRATHAAPPARRAPALTTVSGWSCHDALSLDASL